MCLYPNLFQPLKESFLNHCQQLPYARNRIGSDGQYLGWVCELHSSPLISLDLQVDFHRFLLFGLSSCWSRTGNWENSNYLIVDILKNPFGHLNEDRRTVEYWKASENINWEISRRKESASSLYASIGHDNFRQRLSFRKDFYVSFQVLAKYWGAINHNLDQCARHGDYKEFLCFMRKIPGLATAGGSMLIKLPLILRELRCQNVYDNIPGKLCCVPDSRVIENSKFLLSTNAVKVKNWLPGRNRDSINWLIGVSEKIYDCFGDLYDLPLFAYKDIIQLGESKK